MNRTYKLLKYRVLIIYMQIIIAYCKLVSFFIYFNRIKDIKVSVYMSFTYVQYNIVLQIIINNNNYNKQRLINNNNHDDAI